MAKDFLERQEMIRIEKGDGRVLVKFPYSEDILKKILSVFKGENVHVDACYLTG